MLPFFLPSYTMPFPALPKEYGFFGYFMSHHIGVVIVDVGGQRGELTLCILGERGVDFVENGIDDGERKENAGVRILDAGAYLPLAYGANQFK